ncbi:MAG: amidohydrolase [Thermoplasmata archaeon]
MTEASLWSGGRVFTGRRYVESILVESGRVLFAGALGGAQRLAPEGVERRALGRRLLIPGIVDAHVHLSDLTRVREGFDLSATRSLAELRDRLSAWAVEHPSGPIVGRGWDPERWKGGRWPEIRDVDPVVPDRPTILYHASGHAALLNSAALRASGVLRAGSVRDPAMIGRSADGTPNGILYEEALRLAGSIASDRGPGGEGLARTLGVLAAHGITAVGAMSASPHEVRALRTLDASGRLALTVRAYVRLSELSAFSAPDLVAGSRRLSVVGVKAFLDGAFGPRTAALRRPYSDDPSNSGIPVGDDGELTHQLAEAGRRGLVPALHAIGDSAVERAARLLRPWTGRSGPPARVEHAALTPPEALGPLFEARPALVVQPGFVWSDSWLADRLGPARCHWAYAFRTLINRGFVVAGSSDAPYDPVDPWRGLRAAVDRRDPSGRSANPDPGEALSPEEALGLYTTNAAASVGLPTYGHLEAGGVADLVVLTTPDLRLALASGAPPVRETWVAGQRVYAAPGPVGQQA